MTRPTNSSQDHRDDKEHRGQDTDYRPLNHITRGEGQPVLLIHGLAASRFDWELLAPALHRAGYRTYEVDLLGHGDSHKPGDPQVYNIAAVYAALDSWIANLCGEENHDIEPPFTLVGHSLGGYLSLKFSLNHPEDVRSLVLIDPLYSISQLAPVFRILHRRPGLGIRALEKVPQHVIDVLMGLDPKLGRNLPRWARRQTAIDIMRASPHILNLPRTVPDLTPDLPNLQTPTQVIWGEKDLTLNPRSFPSLVSALPNAQGYAIPNCGHQPHLTRPEVVNPLVLSFLGS
jgi:pimeloyl-ACP methyl ester carboxylesterase